MIHSTMSPNAALKAIREAVRQGQHFLHEHAKERMRKRRIAFRDVEHALRYANAIEPYSGGFYDDEGSSSWRVEGPTVDQKRLAVGVQLTRTETGQFVLIITVF